MRTAWMHTARRQRQREAMVRRVDGAVAALAAAGASPAEVAAERMRLRQAGADAATRAAPVPPLAAAIAVAVARAADPAQTTAWKVARARALIDAPMVDALVADIEQVLRTHDFKTDPGDAWNSRYVEYTELFDDAKEVLDTPVPPGHPLIAARAQYEAAVGAALNAAGRGAVHDLAQMRHVVQFYDNVQEDAAALNAIKSRIGGFGYLQRALLIQESNDLDAQIKDARKEAEATLVTVSLAARAHAGPAALIARVRARARVAADNYAAILAVRVVAPAVADDEMLLGTSIRVGPIHKALGIPLDNGVQSPITTRSINKIVAKITGFAENAAAKRDTVHSLGSVLGAFAYIRPDVFFDKIDDINLKNKTKFTQRSVLARLFGTVDEDEDAASFATMSATTIVAEAAFVQIFVAMMGYLFEDPAVWDAFHESVTDTAGEPGYAEYLRGFFFHHLTAKPGVLDDELYTKATWISTRVSTLSNLFDILRESDSLEDALGGVHGAALDLLGEWNRL